MTNLVDRISALRASAPELAPFWIEWFEADEGLTEVRKHEGPLFRLQEARFLSQLDRVEEARSVLSSIGVLPAGLEKARETLLAEFPGFDKSSPPFAEPTKSGFPTVAGTMATHTLAELYLSQGDRERAVAIFRAVLEREPGDETVRRRLEELTDEPTPDVDGTAPLTAWLGAVQNWRKTLGV